MSLGQRPFGPSPQAVSGQNVFSQNVQAALAQGVLPALQSIASSSETFITNPLNSAQLLAVPIPPGVLEQIPFDIYVSGYVKTGASGTVTLKLYEGTSSTTGSDKNLGTSGAVTMNSLAGPFCLHCMNCVYDSVSGIFSGSFGGFLYETRIADAIFAAFPTGISNSADPVMTFLLTIASSGAAASTPTTINVQNFSVG
jgi:hypothetical protein